MLEQDNELVEFEFAGFSVREFSEARATLRLKPKRTGLFRLVSLEFAVLAIPRRFDFDNVKAENRNYNGELSSC